MNNYQMFRKIQERDKIIKQYSNDTREDLIDLIIEKDEIINNLQFKIDKAIEYIVNNVDLGMDDFTKINIGCGVLKILDLDKYNEFLKENRI